MDAKTEVAFIKTLIFQIQLGQDVSADFAKYDAMGLFDGQSKQAKIIHLQGRIVDILEACIKA